LTSLPDASARPNASSSWVARALASIRVRPSSDGRSIVLALDEQLDAAAVADALYVQDELTEDLLDYFELEAPGRLERRAGELAVRLDRRARATA
jgi:hypothetical protein